MKDLIHEKFARLMDEVEALEEDVEQTEKNKSVSEQELLKLKDILVCQDLLGTEEAQEDNLLARDLRIL